MQTIANAKVITMMHSKQILHNPNVRNHQQATLPNKKKQTSKDNIIKPSVGRRVTRVFWLSGDRTLKHGQQKNN